MAAASLAFGGISLRDTTVQGAPCVRIMSGTGWDGALKIDSERNQPRASLEGQADSVLVVFDRNPFARMAGRSRPLHLAPRVTSSRLILPKSATADLFQRLRIAPSRKKRENDPSKGKTIAPTAPSAPAAPLANAPSVLAVHEPDTAAVEAPEAPTDALTPDSSPAPSVPKSPKSAIVAAPERVHKGVFTVVVDAGHGGKDPGASGRREDGETVLEKMSTLQIARKLRDALSDRKGIKVVMTRDQDVFVELGGRTRIANAAKGDLFVSLHCNSLPHESKRRDEVGGFMVYLLREAKDASDRAIERRENEAIRYETGERQKKESLSPVEWMLLDHQLNEYTKESERFAGLVVRKLQSEGPVVKERTGAGQAGFFVLVGALMPSVLVEMGYLSNPSDVATLSDPQRQERIAQGIAQAIESFRNSRR